MRIRCAAAHGSRWLVFAVILIIIIIIIVTAMVGTVLPARSAPQPGRTTSQIKKPLIYQIGNVVRISADGPRPLLRALDALQDKYGWVVDYEDPQYPDNPDLTTNDQSVPALRRSNSRHLKENFTVDFNNGPDPDSAPDEKPVLKIIVDAYNQSEGAGQFELRELPGGHFDVVGIGVRNQSGEVSSGQPILDLPITLKTQPRSVDETVALICQKVRQQSKIPVTVGAIPARSQKTVAVGGIEVPARTLLLRAIAPMGAHLSWRLLYDSTSKSYRLSAGVLSQ